MKRLLGATEIVIAKLEQGQREIVLVIVRIATDDIAENLHRLGSFPDMAFNVPE